MTDVGRPLTRYVMAGIEDTGLGDSDFRVLEVLRHNGPLPVILSARLPTSPGFDQYCLEPPRRERPGRPGEKRRRPPRSDRRPLPARQRSHCAAFRKHSGQMRKVFSELSPEELHGVELALRKVGKHAAALTERNGRRDLFRPGNIPAEIEGRTDREPDSPTSIPQYIAEQMIPNQVGLRAPRYMPRQDDIDATAKTVEWGPISLLSGGGELHGYCGGDGIPRVGRGHFTYRAERRPSK